MLIKLALDFIEKYCKKSQSPIFNTYKKLVIPTLIKFYENLTEEQTDFLYNNLGSMLLGKYNKHSPIIIKKNRKDYISHYESIIVHMSNLCNGLTKKLMFV